MKSLRLYFVIFSLFLSTVFGVCEVFGGWSGTQIENYPVWQLNDSSEKVGVLGAGDEIRYGDIEGEVYYKIYKREEGGRAGVS